MADLELACVIPEAVQRAGTLPGLSHLVGGGGWAGATPKGHKGLADQFLLRASSLVIC